MSVIIANATLFSGNLVSSIFTMHQNIHLILLFIIEYLIKYVSIFYYSKWHLFIKFIKNKFMFIGYKNEDRPNIYSFLIFNIRLMNITVENLSNFSVFGSLI